MTAPATARTRHGGIARAFAGAVVGSFLAGGCAVLGADLRGAERSAPDSAPGQTHLPVPITSVDDAGGTATPTTAPPPLPSVAIPVLDPEPETTTAQPTDTPPPSTLPPLPVPVGDGWEVVFRDDFSDPELGEVWSTCYWWQVDGGCTISSNSELQWYRPEGVSVAGGEVHLTATDDPQRTTDGIELPFRSGMITTGPRTSDDEPSFAFQYGVMSVRAMLPDGVGTWPAIWLLSADKRSVPEIDVLEQYGGRPDVVTSHVHAEIGEFRFWERFETIVPDVSTTWHVYTVWWLPDSVVFEIDGVEIGRVTDPRFVPDSPMYVIANLAMGGVAGAVRTEDLPQTFRIDEIVISQQVGS